MWCDWSDLLGWLLPGLNSDGIMSTRALKQSRHEALFISHYRNEGRATWRCVVATPEVCYALGRTILEYSVKSMKESRLLLYLISWRDSLSLIATVMQICLCLRACVCAGACNADACTESSQNSNQSAEPRVWAACIFQSSFRIRAHAR